MSVGSETPFLLTDYHIQCQGKPRVSILTSAYVKECFRSNPHYFTASNKSYPSTTEFYSSIQLQDDALNKRTLAILQQKVAKTHYIPFNKLC